MEAGTGAGKTGVEPAGIWGGEEVGGLAIDGTRKLSKRGLTQDSASGSGLGSSRAGVPRWGWERCGEWGAGSRPRSWWGPQESRIAGGVVPECRRARGSQERDSEGVQDGERKLGREKKGEKGAS